MKTFKFYTLGCKVNQYDTQSIKERLLKQGYIEATGSAKAGICLINTCSVTSSADQKSRGLIRRCIKDNPSSEVIVTGCLIKKDYLSVAEIKGVDLIVSRSFFPENITNFSGHTRAFLKIQDGCDNFCSYCKVPLIRGRSRSKPLKQIVNEAKELARNGFKEIVLSGICLGHYGKDLSRGTNLVKAIEKMEDIEGLLRIRLSSIEASDINDELILKIRNSRKLCRHLHIPLQSGDDQVLKDMHRRYCRDGYLAVVKKIKRLIPDMAITTDCLVGFPSEGKNQFLNTLDAIKEISPLKVHIFPYSERDGTVASRNFRHLLPNMVIKERLQRMQKLAFLCRSAYMAQFLDRKMDVLVEARPKNNPFFWEGYTSNYLRVRIKSRQDLGNQLIRVRLIRAMKDYIIGVTC